jgi:hypothetical protein
MAELVILPALYLGLVIGIYEAILLGRDVSVPTHKFGHMIHALIFALIAVFTTMNVSFMFGLFPGLTGIPLIGNEHIFRVAIGLVAMIKIHAVSSAISGGAGTVGMKEKWSHSFLIAGLIIAAPYAWPYIEPAVGFLPGI